MKKTLSPYQVELDNAIRDIVDFPKTGIVFKDLTPVLLDVQLMQRLLILLRLNGQVARWIMLPV